VGVYLLGSMSSTTVYRGRLADGIDLGRVARDAVELANAAHEAARSTPTAVRALAAERFANAQAAAGNTRGFHAAAEEARTLLSTPGAGGPPVLPELVGPAVLEGELAQGALTLAGVTSRDSHRLLEDAEETLSRRVTEATTPVVPGTTRRGWPGRSRGR
jgi:hypothetical protein